QKTDKALVEDEARRFGGALRRVFEALGDGGRALIVGHSPMHEAGVYGLTGQVIAPIPKGGGVRIVQDGRDFRIEPLTCRMSGGGAGRERTGGTASRGRLT